MLHGMKRNAQAVGNCIDLFGLWHAHAMFDLSEQAHGKTCALCEVDIFDAILEA